MVTKYYKTNCNSVLETQRALVKDRAEMRGIGREVAGRFDADPIVKTSTFGVRFAGLELRNYREREDRILWTTPRKNGISWPRHSLTKAHLQRFVRGMSDDEARHFTANKRTELKILKKEYKKMTGGIPEVHFDDFFESIGTDCGSVMFGGLSWFEYEGFIYLSSDLDFSGVADEISGSEFDDARESVRNK